MLTEEQRVLVADNAKLVTWCLKKFTRSQWYGVMSRDDLVSEGYVALCRAAVGFDATLGFKFSTYAVRAIMFRWLNVLKAAASRPLHQLDFDGRVVHGDHAEVDARLDVTEALEQLDERLRQVVEDWMQEMTLQDSGKRLGVSKERCRQLRGQAATQLREAMAC